MSVNAILIAVNTILWIVMFLRLKKKLSPEGVIKEVRKELDRLLLQINSESDRNIRLIQKQIEQVKEVSLEAQQLCDRAEERIAMLYGELDKASSVKSMENHLYLSGEQAKAPEPRQEAMLPDKALVPEASKVPTVSEVPDVAELPTGVRPAPVVVDDTFNKSRSPIDSYMKEQLRFVPETGPASPEPPRKIEIPEFIKAEKPIEIKKPFRQQVKEMLALGHSIEEIAHKTGRSTQEVKIIIEIL